MIVTKISPSLNINSLLSLFCPFLETKKRIKFLASWWSGNEKNFCLLFLACHTLLQKYAEFNGLL